jgi:hypothetical protein
VRAGLLLAVALVAAIAACGTSAATKLRPIHFGLTGGNIRGYTTAIKANGVVTATIRGQDGVRRTRIAVKRVRKLGREIRQAHLTDRICAGSNPDVASRFIRLGNRRVTVRGGCDPRFERVWSILAKVARRLHG